VDVTLAVCELSQKLCSNFNLSDSAVPKEFLARVKIPIISVEPPLRAMFFFLFVFPISYAHKQQVEANKNFCVQCLLLEKLPGMVTVLVCHTKTDPMRISLVFEK